MLAHSAQCIPGANGLKRGAPDGHVGDVPGGLSPVGLGPETLRAGSKQRKNCLPGTDCGSGPGGLRPDEGGPEGVVVGTGGLKPGALGPGATGAKAGAGALVAGVAPPPPCLAWIRADRLILIA